MGSRSTRALLPALLASAASGPVSCTEYDIADREIVDVFNQDPTEQVDILLVVDNSGSMLGYQLLLGARFHEFISAFVDADVDYHIGVVTTTVSEIAPVGGCTQDDVDAIPPPGHLVGGRYITTASPEAEETFRELVAVGACGSGDEQGLESARLALSEEARLGPNYGFIRPEAALSLIFVSDEQDGSVDPVWDYIHDFYEVKGQRARGVVNASAFVITDLDACIVPSPGSSEGTRYVAVAEETGGVVANLCAASFSEVVEALSLNASRVRDTFFLSAWPDPGTLQVSVEDAVWPCGDGWRYAVVPDGDGEDAPAIVFERTRLPRSNARIAVRYDRGSGDPAVSCADGPPGEAR